MAGTGEERGVATVRMVRVCVCVCGRVDGFGRAPATFWAGVCGVCVRVRWRTFFWSPAMVRPEALVDVCGATGGWLLCGFFFDQTRATCGPARERTRSEGEWRVWGRGCMVLVDDARVRVCVRVSRCVCAHFFLARMCATCGRTWERTRGGTRWRVWGRGCGWSWCMPCACMCACVSRGGRGSGAVAVLHAPARTKPLGHACARGAVAGVWAHFFFSPAP